MSKITPILEEYKLLEEKIIWFISYLDHITMINKRAIELYFRCTQIPRNTRWNDVNIINIVEGIDMTRNSLEEFISKCEESLILNCQELLNNTKIQIQFLSNLEEKFSQSLGKYLEDLMYCRKNHLEAWENNNLDIWLTENALKNSLKNYLQKTEKWDDDLKKELQSVEKSLFEIAEAFVEVVTRSQSIQLQQHSSISNIHHKTVIQQNRFKKDYFFDFPENEPVNETKQEEKRRNKFDDEFNRMITDLRCYNENIKKDIGIHKYGIFRIKKGYEVRIGLVLISETKYMHAFDIEQMISDVELSSSDKNILKKLIDLKKGSSFFKFKNESLNSTEEKYLIELTESMMNQLNVRKYVIRGFPFYTKEKAARFDKARKELIITDKKSPTIKSLFISSSIKIKSYIDRDSFELFYAFYRKPEATQLVSDNKTSTESKSEENTNIIEYMAEENPWQIEEENLQTEKEFF